MSKYIRVYRVENARGKGPFTAWAGATQQYRKRYNDANFFPNPHQEGLLGDRFAMADYLCACDSLGQLFHWFPPEMLPRLAADGFILRSWLVPHEAVKRGKYQCIIPAIDRAQRHQVVWRFR